MPTARGGAAVGAIDGKLYVAGGSTDGRRNSVASVEVYDPVTGSWETRTPMLEARAFAISAVLNGMLYVIGGGNDGAPDQSVERYDPLTDTWEHRVPVPLHPHQVLDANICGAATVEGRIWVICGWGLAGGIFSYDPILDRWRTVDAEPEDRGLWEYSMDSIDDRIYLAGGALDFCGFSSEQASVYDTVSGDWSTGSPIPTPRRVPGSAVLHGQLYVVGGESPGRGVLGALEAYDPVFDTWASWPEMPTARAHPAAAVIDGKLYVAGGFEYNAFCTGRDEPAVGVLEVYDPEAKTCVCHVPPGNRAKGHTLCVGPDAVEVHLARHPDDAPGACAEP